jgi:hypothetical protein
MDGFWAAILFGAVFGFLGSIAANLIHNPLLALIDRWRLSSEKKRFAREAEFHQFISDLKTGKIDKYIYLVRICATMVMGFLGSLICGGTGILLSYGSNRPDAQMFEYGLGVSSGFFLSFYVVGAARYHAVAYGLNNFEKLDAEFQRKLAARPNENTRNAPPK